jgi:hypothetical protein
MKNLLIKCLIVSANMVLAIACGKTTEDTSLPKPKIEADVRYFCSETVGGWRYDYYILDATKNNRLVGEKVTATPNSSQTVGTYWGDMLVTIADDLVTLRSDPNDVNSQYYKSPEHEFVLKINTSSWTGESTQGGKPLHMNLKCEAY